MRLGGELDGAEAVEGDRRAARTVRVGRHRASIGEGGLDEAEIASARRAGFTGWRLGNRVLRTETAPVAALAVLQQRYGDLG